MCLVHVPRGQGQVGWEHVEQREKGLYPLLGPLGAVEAPDPLWWDPC